MVIEVYNSVGGAAFFERLLGEWEAGGAEVRRHHVLDEAEYRRTRGRVGRLGLRGRLYGEALGSCLAAGLRSPGGDSLRVVTTNPFFAPALVARMAGGARTIQLLYDLFPDALFAAGKVRTDSWTARGVAAVTRAALRDCGATVFLGARLRAAAESSYGAARRGVVIPVGADGGPFRDAPPGTPAAGAGPEILYAGNLGHLHETETLVPVLREAGRTGARWRFHSSGPGYGRLRELVGTPDAVAWGEPLGDAAWVGAMRRAAVALVTIAPGGERVVMPSKVYSALVAGQAVLAVCRRESDLADLVAAHGCGWVVEPGDPAGLARAVQEIAGDPALLLEKRRRAYAAGHGCYDMAVVARQWETLFAELSAPAGAAAVYV